MLKTEFGAGHVYFFLVLFERELRQLEANRLLRHPKRFATKVLWAQAGASLRGRRGPVRSVCSFVTSLSFPSANVYVCVRVWDLFVELVHSDRFSPQAWVQG